MNTLQNKGSKSSETKILSRIGWILLVIIVVAAVMFSARPVQAAGVCPAPGTGLPGAVNMFLDKTMFTIPVARAATQGVVGMERAISNTACP